MNITNELALREPLETIVKSSVSLENIMYMRDLLSSMSSIVCILNRQNQIVFYNDVITEKYGLDLEKDILGFRPGEVFKCVNAKNDTGGCGTTEKCQYCGAYNSFQKCWDERRKVVNECRIVRENGAHTVQLDLEIMATPFVQGDEYIVVSMQDITEKKRKELLERIFFHDIINIAGSLSGVLQLLPMLSENEKEEYHSIASSLSNQIVDEIRAQQQMIKAENGELQLKETVIETGTFLRKVTDQIRFHQVAIDKKVDITDFANNVQFVSDETLLTRVLINMAKNALEAVNFGQQIRITSRTDNGQIWFEVHNPTYMPEEVQYQLFQRSFSTKGSSRGMGTYSMKLIGERYLGGEVGFSSSPESGTTFYIALPRKKETR